LYSGTICSLGTAEQVADLTAAQPQGRLGCFALTEKLAGVSSGLVVNTTCTFVENLCAFVLHCPNDGARKNWISQGCVADDAVVIADLVLKGKSHGPHAFVMPLRKNGALVKGVTITDMGDKTIANDLDNASIHFDNVVLPRSALLSKYSEVDAVGNYVQKIGGTSSIDMIGQRLYSGRTVIADSALVFCRSLFAATKKYADAKDCWAPGKSYPKLSQLPQLQQLFYEADQRLSQLEEFLKKICAALSPSLRSGDPPPPALINAIACAKVKCIETAIDLCWKLKQEVGSFALMRGSGFENLDYLNCCKFAEGDSRILSQKIARDRLGQFKRKQEGTEKEVALCMSIGAALASSKNKAQAWNQQWQSVYQLADLVIDRVVQEWAPRVVAKL